MVTIMVTMIDKNTFDFNKCILELDLASRRKPTIFLILYNETRSVNFSSTPLTMKKVFCTISKYLLGSIPTYMGNQECKSCKTYEKYS